MTTSQIPTTAAGRGVEVERLPAQAVCSFAGVGYHLGLPRLSADERVLGVSTGSRMDVFTAAMQVEPKRSIATRTGAQPDLRAACIAGGSQRDHYLYDIAAADLELRTVQRKLAYRWACERARAGSDKCGAHATALLGVKPTDGIS